MPKKKRIGFFEQIGRGADRLQAKAGGLKIGKRVGGFAPNDDYVKGKIVRISRTRAKGMRFIVKLDKPTRWHGEKLTHLSFTGSSLFAEK